MDLWTACNAVSRGRGLLLVRFFDPNYAIPHSVKLVNYAAIMRSKFEIMRFLCGKIFILCSYYVIKFNILRQYFWFVTLTSATKVYIIGDRDQGPTPHSVLCCQDNMRPLQKSECCQELLGQVTLTSRSMNHACAGLTGSVATRLTNLSII